MEYSKMGLALVGSKLPIPNAKIAISATKLGIPTNTAKRPRASTPRVATYAEAKSIEN